MSRSDIKLLIVIHDVTAVEFKCCD